jgi:hypothetical protein
MQQRLIRFDRRGSGLSDPFNLAELPSIEQQAARGSLAASVALVWRHAPVGLRSRRRRGGCGGSASGSGTCDAMSVVKIRIWPGRRRQEPLPLSVPFVASSWHPQPHRLGP